MKLLMYYENDQIYVGIKEGDGVRKTHLLADALLQTGTSRLSQLAEACNDDTLITVPESNLDIAPSVPNPGKILCVGLNYRQHALESGMEPPTQPVLFSKFNNTIAAHGDEVSLASAWQQVDYESELVVVMGKRARYVSEDQALDYVLGYTNGNDLSERELQFRSGQWLLGKTSDRFLPLGPYLVTADEIPDPQALRIQGWLNGELRQDSTTADMIFSVAQVIAYASRYMTLEAGDIISTGTPEGVIFGQAPEDRLWLQAGDVYEVAIDGLGRLRNRMVSETAVHA
ncbi:MAG: fumarylacetoacetate hydrolase family protein [Anaerolineae bacterium]